MELVKGILYIDKDKLRIGDDEYSFEDIATKESYEFISESAPMFSTGEIYDNILFYVFAIDVLVAKHFLVEKGIKEIVFENSDKKLRKIFVSASKNLRVTIQGKDNPKSYSGIRFRSVLKAAEMYLLFRSILIKHKPVRIRANDDVAVIRTSATKAKIHEKGNRILLFESEIGKGTFYEQFSFMQRKRAIKKAYKDACKMYSSLDKNIEKWGLQYFREDIMLFVAKRLVFVLYYGFLLDILFSKDWIGRFISGNNLDMYACIEESIASNNGIKTVCIPHGLEFGYRFPHCFTGDIFYTTSKEAAIFLNKLYRVNKFIYDDLISGEMFRCDYESNSNARRIVYFSEPRDPEVNFFILDRLLEECKKAGIELYIKHHPKDILDDYAKYDGIIHVIDDLKEALSGNICIARKSTVLVEGLYNKSTCISILTNEKDKTIFATFPSLKDERIKVFYDVNLMADWIKSVL